MLEHHFCHFFDDDAFVPTDRDGFRKRVILGTNLELWFWRIAGGASGSILHRHEHQEQLGIIARGALNFRISADPDDQTRVTLHTGDVYLAPTNIWHGDSTFIGDDELDEVWILDVFSPPRTGGQS